MRGSMTPRALTRSSRHESGSLSLRLRGFGGGPPEIHRGSLPSDEGGVRDADAHGGGGGEAGGEGVAVSGKFERGDTVRILDENGREIARGIANYASRDLQQITRRRSDEIEGILGFHYGDEVIHRNDLVMLG